MEKLSVKGQQPLLVTREPTGVLRVRAKSRADLFRGLGFCHAHDRGLQMALLRILGNGRGSELLVGDDRMLAIDTFFRRANFPGGAASEAAKLTASEKEMVDAYCDGVNQVLVSRPPWEYRLFGYKPEPWTPTDSVMLSRLISYVSLAQTQGDLERLLLEMIQAGVGKGHLEELFPGKLEGLDVDLVKQVRLGERVVPDAVAWSVMVPKAVASNNWAVAGRKTRSGKAMLASDPHLEVNCLPAVWYECILEMPGRFMMGAGMAGLPAILIGRNNDVAWGVTYSFLDGVDSWIEEVKDGKYRREEGGRTVWREFAVRTEVVKRKKKPDTVLTFHENEHGVLDGDPTVPGFLLASRWASHTGSGARSIQSSLAMLDARSVADGMRNMGSLETAWNWVFADKEGNIGYQMSGRMPRRRAGVSGLVPLPGWDPANDWQGYHPPEDLPRTLNPECGFITTANQDLNHLGRAKPITSPMGPWRSDRITEVLAARNDWDVDGMRALQMDLFSRQAKVYLAVLLPLVGSEPAARLLRDWDMRCTPESTAATLFESFYHHLFRGVIGGAVGAAVARHLLEETAMLADFYDCFDRILLAETSVWLAGRDRATVWREAFAKAAAEPPAPWSKHQTLPMTHMLFGGKLPRFLGFDRGPIVIPGSRATVHQGQVYRSGDRVTSFAPSYRMVTDLAESTMHTVLAGGTSDRRFSKWYVGDLDNWTHGRLKPLKAGS